MPDASLLECFESPAPIVDGSARDFVIEHVSEEFTSVCPKTGHPDFGHVTLRYVPGDRCVELKSLKLYYQSFRNEGIFYEAVTNRIADDLQQAMQPNWMLLQTDWKGRGGIRSTISVEVGDRPAIA
ncbi:MAG: preQ(1) synthase [Planctomycetota bacterium]